MKQRIILILSILMICGQIQAACGSCAKRRKIMMERRPTVETAYQSYIKENTTIIDEAVARYEKGKAAPFIERMEKDYLRAQKKPEYRRMLAQKNQVNVRRMHLYYGRSTIDGFLGYPEKLAQVRDARGYQIQEFINNNPDYALVPMLTSIIQMQLSSVEKVSLQTFAELLFKQETTTLEKKLIELDRKFWLCTYLLNIKAMKTAKIKKAEIEKQCLCLDFEKWSRMEALCKEEPDLAAHCKVIKNLIPKLAKFLKWERFLSNIATAHYKTPNKTDLEIQEIQQNYMKQRSECIRKDRELAAFR